MLESSETVRIMVTGHRELPASAIDTFSSWVDRSITEIIQKTGAKRVEAITGMALGADTVFARCVLQQKTLAITVALPMATTFDLIAAIPFEQQTGWRYDSERKLWIQLTQKAWPIPHRDEWDYIRRQAQRVVYVDRLPASEGYSVSNSQVGRFHPEKFKKRNKWMVDYAAQDSNGFVLTAFSGRPSGTSHCIGLAKAAGLDIQYWPWPK